LRIEARSAFASVSVRERAGEGRPFRRRGGSAWKAAGGYGNQDGENANADRERLWLSPYCEQVGERPGDQLGLAGVG
jgi:hypothetical protein